MNSEELMKLYGVKYINKDQDRTHHTANDKDLYYYDVYTGEQTITVEKGDCLYTISGDDAIAMLIRGPAVYHITTIGVVIRGYMPESKTSSVTTNTVLPYVNGCSTKQIFPPDRPGDPTMQMLIIPPHSAEQAHHIHSTVRVVYVLEGEGTSIVGMDNNIVSTPLLPGMVCILDPMCPHHFETNNTHLKVLPIHIWSSISGIEANHPMFNGTHMTNQG